MFLLNLKYVVKGQWLMVGDCISALCGPVIQHRMGDPQRRRNVLSPNHQPLSTSHVFLGK
jgi:hypothetical protein